MFRDIDPLLHGAANPKSPRQRQSAAGNTRGTADAVSNHSCRASSAWKHQLYQTNKFEEALDEAISKIPKGGMLKAGWDESAAEYGKNRSPLTREKELSQVTSKLATFTGTVSRKSEDDTFSANR
jgi:hypothetical protein